MTNGDVSRSVAATVDDWNAATMVDELEAITPEDDDPLAHVGDEADAPPDVGRPADDEAEGDGS